MRDSIKWRTIFVLAIIAVCVFFFFFNTKTKQFNPDGTLKLGLDLKGGVHLLLLMDTDVSVKNRINSDIESIKEYLKSKNIAIQQIYRPQDKLDAIVVKGKDPNLGPTILHFTSDNMKYLNFTSHGPGNYELTMKSNYESDLRDKAITQSVAIIRNRIDRYGVAETAIHREGLHTNKIVVEIPGVEDSTEVKALIGTAAQLGWYETLSPQNGAPSKDAILKQYNGKLPEDVQIVAGSPAEPNVAGKFYALKALPIVTGADIQDSRVETDEYGRPVVGFQLSAVAGQKFREFTSTHIKQHAAIVLDNQVISNPVIQSEIGDRGQISGDFTPEEAREFVLQLKSGALPAIPHFGEERTVGPSLGLESIHKGAYSGLIGIIAVFIFVLLYYRGSGINAIITLLLNLVILMGIMSTFGMTLTVPGIAGIILTIGMAVDANVLIFERIKEELLDKRSVRTAIVNGFGKAFWTIFDSNVTTLVAALFLLQFGSGPVKGFAITLTVGLLASMFTAISSPCPSP
ncbi:MAG: protein translocase subunit SecD [Acidobacteriota bacterium]